MPVRPFALPRQGLFVGLLAAFGLAELGLMVAAVALGPKVGTGTRMHGNLAEECGSYLRIQSRVKLCT